MKYLRHAQCARVSASFPVSSLSPAVASTPSYPYTPPNPTAMGIQNTHPYLNTSMAAPWAPPEAMQGSTAQQWRASIQQHPASVPASSVPSYYTSNPPASNHQRKQSVFPGGTKKSKKSKFDDPVTSMFTCVLFPYPVCVKFPRCQNGRLIVLKLTNVLQDPSEVYPGAPIIPFDKLKSLMNTFLNWGLCQDVSLTAPKSMPILQQLLNAVLTHTRSENIHWASDRKSVV